MIEGMRFTDSDRDLRPSDLAYKILKQLKSPLHYKDLINAIIDVMGTDGGDADRLRVKIYTEINLDSRFVHKGKGLWCLAEFLPKPAIQSIKDDNPLPARAKISGRLSEEIQDDSQGSPGKEYVEEDWFAETDE